MARYTVRPNLIARGPLSFGDPLERRRDTIRLGRLAEAGPSIDVEFDVSGEFVVAVFGKRGSGKSYSLGSMLESLCVKTGESPIGRCSRQRAVLVLDTLNIFWTLEQPLRAEDEELFPAEWRQMRAWGLSPVETDVLVWVPGGFAPSNTPGNYQTLRIPPSELAVDDWADLLEVDLFTDRIGQLLFEVHTRVTQDGWTSGEETHVARQVFGVDDLLGCLHGDAELGSLYSPETVRALAQRIKAVRALGFFGPEAAPYRELLRPGRTSVLLLNRLPDALRAVLTSVLLRRILSERSEASELQKQLKFNRRLSADERRAMEDRVRGLAPPTVVALDEAQNALPSERATKATQTIIKYVREGRNHGLSFVLTTQQPSAIDSRILAQVDTLISHKLTIAADVRRLSDNLKSRAPDAVVLNGRELSFEEWLRSLSQGQAIVSNTEESRHFVIEVRPRVCPHGGQGTV